MGLHQNKKLMYIKERITRMSTADKMVENFLPAFHLRRQYVHRIYKKLSKLNSKRKHDPFNELANELNSQIS
jgi:hypothetical protein